MSPTGDGPDVGPEDEPAATGSNEHGSPDDPDVLQLLRTEPLHILGRLRGSSNATLLAEVGGTGLLGVYKPAMGERPLWDFPPGLWRREIAAYELSEALGFGLVPSTVHRVEGPHGEGSLQRFIDARFDEHYFTIQPDASSSVQEQLMELCVFDLVANSADRKAGHCLIDDEERIWAIDNGLSFHTELKIRTVIWDFAGQELPSTASDSLRRLTGSAIPDRVTQWLSDAEVDALDQRARWLLDAGVFPHDPTGRRYPWPLV